MRGRSFGRLHQRLCSDALVHCSRSKLRTFDAQPESGPRKDDRRPGYLRSLCSHSLCLRPGGNMPPRFLPSSHKVRSNQPLALRLRRYSSSRLSFWPVLVWLCVKYVVWPLINWINFGYVPLRYRPHFVSCCQLGWQVFISAVSRGLITFSHS